MSKIKRYKVYRNLHKNCFSIQKYDKEKKGYRVDTRLKRFFMFDCDFKVLKSGRDKVLRDKRKNVHAFVMPINIIITNKTFDVSKLREIYYNPYKFSNFVYKDTKKKAGNVDCILAYKNKLYEYKK